ncbi:flagellar hook-length control protein FliK [Sphingomonas sp. GlSt437]|uniref:flagellar hook-length control protein FliK n=1 Tax=Sphingomonas sp. GlSt437 TaxID=3389970 RepID=UPI003A8430F0
MATISTVTNTASALVASGPASAPATAQTAAQTPAQAVASPDFAALLTGADIAANPIADLAASTATPPASTDASTLQGVAGDGKDLPSGDDQDQADKDADQQDPANAAALIWLALAMPVVAPALPAPANDVARSAPAAPVATVGAIPDAPSALIALPADAPALTPAATSLAQPSPASGALDLATVANNSNDAPPTPVDPASPPSPAKADRGDSAKAQAAPRDPVIVLANALRTSANAAPLANQPPAAATPAASAPTPVIPTPVADNATPIARATDPASTSSPTAPSAPQPVAKPNPDVQPLTLASLPGAANVALVGSVQPASQAFAAALSVAQPAAKRSNRDPGSLPTAQPFTGIADASATASVDAKPATVDTSHTKWVEGIIDHIELLRDASNASDTRIRLLPDALGKIDVAIRKDGDTINVRFSSDQAPTRQLLADAQPRLAEIAAGRGIRLGQTLIDGGDSGAAQQQQRGAPQQAPHARQPIANAPHVKGDDSDDTVETAAIAGWLA